MGQGFLQAKSRKYRGIFDVTSRIYNGKLPESTINFLNNDFNRAMMDPCLRSLLESRIALRI